jgi:regulator of sigma E protease
VSWLLTILGFTFLIIAHEGGHFAAAKAVGMRVERFSLFFGKPLVSVRRGETEYGIGPFPLGGYVKISGMNPYEELPPEVAPRAYYRQPVWKRIVVIGAGPAVNIVLAFAILWALVLANGVATNAVQVSSTGLQQPASQYLVPGDRVISIDGVRNDPNAAAAAVGKLHCAGPPVSGCEATRTVHVVVRRDGRLVGFDIRPRYDATKGIQRVRLGFSYASVMRDVGPAAAASESVGTMWDITTRSVSVFAHIFNAKDRKQVSSVVGAATITQQAVGYGATEALWILALISLSLAIINLFPFLPLDGGHIFFAVMEKVRGRAVPFSIMERASAVGFALVAMLFLVGLTNDIGHLDHGGFHLR